MGRGTERRCKASMSRSLPSSLRNWITPNSFPSLSSSEDEKGMSWVQGAYLTLRIYTLDEVHLWLVGPCDHDRVIIDPAQIHSHCSRNMLLGFYNSPWLCSHAITIIIMVLSWIPIDFPVVSSSLTKLTSSKQGRSQKHTRPHRCKIAKDIQYFHIINNSVHNIMLFKLYPLIFSMQHRWWYFVEKRWN